MNPPSRIESLEARIAPVNGELWGSGKIMVKGSVEFADIPAAVVAPESGSAPNFAAQISRRSRSGRRAMSRSWK